MEILVSVIVPVYNTKEYLPECVNSILEQTYKNIQVILVVDGSTDESLEICTAYVEKHERIKDSCRFGRSTESQSGAG